MSDPRFKGLPDKEIERLAALPRVLKSDTYKVVEEWYDANKEKLAKEHPGKYLYCDAVTMATFVGESFDHAHSRYNELMGGLSIARYVFGVQLTL